MGNSFTQKSVAVGMLCFLTGCAGPMSPFGAIQSWIRRPWAKTASHTQMERDGKSARVRFEPRRQVLHDGVPFSIVIDDPEGIPEHFTLHLSYNGVDVGSQFVARAERLYLDGEHRQLRLLVNNFRVIAGRENEIEVSYRRSALSRETVARFEPPRCSAFAGEQPRRAIASVRDFDPPADYLDLINNQARTHGLNPYFVAGLIAQESAFDARAVSRGRALGLTQITGQSQSEILKRFSGWPRYPGIEEMPLPLLRLSVLDGKVNAQNEWRLDPVLSIQGGVEYLQYLREYWSRADKRAQIENSLGVDEAALSEVILASYNSGANRVSQALTINGKSYLQDADLGEARRYVGRVVSYCDYFSGQGD